MTKEDIKQICQIYDNFRSERDAATIACNSDDTFWEHILATYNLSQPSIPSNLDEPDRNLDIDNIGHIKNILSFHKKNTQIIAVVHNPLLIYALSKKKNINFIEFTPGYIDRIKKQINEIVYE